MLRKPMNSPTSLIYQMPIVECMVSQLNREEIMQMGATMDKVTWDKYPVTMPMSS
jgi:hypothetical protein